MLYIAHFTLIYIRIVTENIQILKFGRKLKPAFSGSNVNGGEANEIKIVAPQILICRKQSIVDGSAVTFTDAESVIQMVNTIFLCHSYF
jgi:hypothetical protein